MKKTSDLASHLMLILVVLLFAGTVVWTGYHDKSHNCVIWCNNVPTLYLPIFYNADSLAFYMERAYSSDDPKALFVTGMASRLRFLDPDFPKDLPTVDPEPEGAYMLVLAAELGSEDAMTYIRCEEAHGTWRHVLPKNFK